MVGALVGLSISKTLQRLAYQALFELQYKRFVSLLYIPVFLLVGRVAYT